MNSHEFFSIMLDYLTTIPAAVICYLPMKNQLRFSGAKIALCAFGAISVSIAIASWLCILLDYSTNIIGFPMMIIWFVLYRLTLKTDFFRSIAVFIFSCVLASFPTNFACIFDAWLHPDSTVEQFSLQASLFKFIVCCVLTLIIAYPLQRLGSKLIDTIKVSSVWLSILFVSVIFVFLNIAITPRNYSTLYVGRCFPLYIIILAVLLLLLIFLYTSLYHIAMEIQKNAELAQRLKFFEMQEKQYLMQKNYIDATSKQRHDFRQSIFTLSQLANNGDLKAVKEFLAEYIGILPKTEVYPYCKNNAVNALLNYYAQSASEKEVRIDWNIEIPDDIKIPEPDFCSLLGNIIENALSGCITVGDKNNRYHCLSIAVKNDVNLYIVSTNSFNGIVKLKNGQYLSTKRNGNGIGLSSMKMIAEKYHGIVRFSHSVNEFYADIALRLPF